MYEGFRNVDRKYLLCLRYGMEWYGMVWYAASHKIFLAHFLKMKVNSNLVCILNKCMNCNKEINKKSVHRATKPLNNNNFCKWAKICR